MTRLGWLLWGSLAVKLALTAALPLTSDEAYYWIWARHLQLSYFDHPPFVAWLFYFGDFTRWFPGSVRWPGVVMAHAGLWIWLRVLARWFDSERLFWWLALALLSPLLGGSALVVTPDVPLMFFYALATLVFVRWRARPDFWWSLILGLTLGLGVTSKYMMVLFPLSVLVPALRRRDTRWGLALNLPWLVLGGLVGACPVWLWNLRNDFASLRFQADHGLGRAWKLKWTTEYLGVQLLLISPVVAYFASRGRRRLPEFFVWLAWTPLAFFLCTTSRGYVEANWPLAGYPPMIALAVAQWPSARRGLIITAGVWGAVFALLAGLLIVRPPWSRTTKLNEFYAYEDILPRVRDLDPVYTRNYQMASKLTFELGRPIYKLRGMVRRDFFDEMPESLPTADEYVLIAERGDHLSEEMVERGHRVVERNPLDGNLQLWKIRAR